jgi:undecaprenyl-diphosphatase
MTTFQAIILAIIQGLTEFLPISSSAHLILPSQVLGWPDQGLAFDVAVHLGTLLAVVIYFREEVQQMTIAWFGSVFKQQHNAESRLAWGVVWGTIPVGLAGLIFNGFIEQNLRSTLVIAITTVLFGLLLWFADSKAKVNRRDEHSLKIKDIAVIGLAQMLALIPGTSRSGVTITAGLMVGLTREGSARFSFLLSIPVIILAGGLKTLELIQQSTAVDWSMMLLGIVISAVSAFVCIHVFLKLLEKVGMIPFVIYRLLLGGVLLFWIL